MISAGAQIHEAQICPSAPPLHCIRSPPPINLSPSPNPDSRIPNLRLTAGPNPQPSKCTGSGAPHHRYPASAIPTPPAPIGISSRRAPSPPSRRALDTPNTKDRDSPRRRVTLPKHRARFSPRRREAWHPPPLHAASVSSLPPAQGEKNQTLLTPNRAAGPLVRFPDPERTRHAVLTSPASATSRRSSGPRSTSSTRCTLFALLPLPPSKD